MDTVMVGSVGEIELAAVSLANQFINIFHIFCMGIGMGASVLVARYFSMNDSSSLKKTVTIMLRLVLAFAAVFSVITLLFPGPIMQMYTGQRENADRIITSGIEYLSWSVVTYFFLGASVTCTILLRNVNKVKMPLYTSIGIFFVNVGANYIFIFGKFGAPRMGVAGAALGTLIARVFEFVIICGYLFIFDKSIGYRVKEFFRPVGVIWREYIRISIPVLISDGILAFGNNAVAMVIGRLGDSFAAANAVAMVALRLSTTMIQGFSQSGAIITGYTLGEGDRKKAQEQGYAFLGLGFAFGLASAIILALVSEPLIYFCKLEGESKSIARSLIWSLALIIVFQATNSIMTKGVLRGGGDTKMLMLADNIFLWAAAVPLGALAGLVFHLPAFWIYFFLKCDQLLKCIWCVIRLRGGKWIKKIRSESEIS